MYVSKKRALFWQKLPIIGTFLLGWRDWRKEQKTPCYRLMEKVQTHTDLLPYMIDMYPLLSLPFGHLDKEGVLYNTANTVHSGTYHATSIAQYALALWNEYLKSEAHEHRVAFLTQARWLLKHEVRFSAETGGWPISFELPAYQVSQPWLSALTQGNVISVFIRAYQLTDEISFLQAAQRAVHIFTLDILDGGVQAPVGEDGIFFEEVAVYPAAHILNGYMLAVFGLYDYVALTQDKNIEVLIQKSVETLHTLLVDFDAGYWTRYDLLHNRLAPKFYHALHITLLQALASYSGCEHCAQLAARWESYQRSHLCRLRYFLTSRAVAWNKRKMKPLLRRLFFRMRRDPGAGASLLRVCVPITSFPVAGGMRGVLANVEQVMGGQWRLTYLTHHKGEETSGQDIEVFGLKRGWPGRFPNIWLYGIAGGWKLFRLLRERPGYELLLPQDGAFTGAFSALLGKMAGLRVVCMDHGNVTWLDDAAYRQEQRRNLSTLPWPQRLLGHVRDAIYWPSLHIFIRLAARYTDQFLVAGDEVADVYRRRLGVSSRKIYRYAYMVDPLRFSTPDPVTRAEQRKQERIAADDIVITLINRLAPEKGLSFALEGIAGALAELAPEIRSRVRVLIAGSGSLRSQVEADIQRYGMEEMCALWGEARPADVIFLLGISDIFLYAGTRGTNYSVAVLEAMAAGCAVIASNAPRSNSKLLADNRGMVVKPGKSAEIKDALICLCNDPVLCHQMGQKAREYVFVNHTATMLKRNLLRVARFAPLLIEEVAKQSE